MSLLDDIGKKLNQFGQDIETGGSDAFNAAKDGVGKLFGTSSTPTSGGSSITPAAPSARLTASNPLQGGNPSPTTLPAPQAPQPVTNNPSPEPITIAPKTPGLADLSTPKTVSNIGTTGKGTAVISRAGLQSTPNAVGGGLLGATKSAYDLLAGAPKIASSLYDAAGNAITGKNSSSRVTQLLNKPDAALDKEASTLSPTAQAGYSAGNIVGTGLSLLAGGEGAEASRLGDLKGALTSPVKTELAELLGKGKTVAEAPSVPNPVPAEPTNPPNLVQTPQLVNTDADAQRSMLDVINRGGNLDDGVKAYMEASGVDHNTAEDAVLQTLRHSGIASTGEADSGAAIKSLELPEGTPTRTGQAAQRLVNEYMQPLDKASSSSDLVDYAKGKEALFKKLGQGLEDAMSKDLVPEERTQVRDALEGSPEPLSPKVASVVNVAKQLNDMGYNILDVTHPNGVGRVAQYATRVARSGLKRGGGKVEQSINSIKDLFSTESQYGQGRQVGKFVDENGNARYGTRDSLGLRNKNGTLVGKDGVVVRPAGATTKELHGSGVIKYEEDYGKIANLYHSSVGSSKARYDALRQILTDPERFKVSNVPTPGASSEITRIPELAGMYGPRKLVQSLQEAFSTGDERGPAERVWQGINNGIVQGIVFNPLFHGRNLNQLAGLAAGKVSGFGPALLKESYARLASSDPAYRTQLMTRMLRAGVATEDYGASRETVLSKALKSANIPEVNKLSARAMAKIDGGIRMSLFDVLTKGGMEDREAARTVNEFLGDNKAGGAISRNVGMFWHYARTQLRAAKGIATNPGSAAAFAEQAAFHFGVLAAFKQVTGNKNATIGNPGVFGLINNANELRKGDVGAVVADKLNPTIVAGLNQVEGKDLYSGTALKTPGARISNAVNTLASPTQYTSKVASGKNSAAQSGLQVLTGANLPHVTGAPAAPNFTSGPGNLLNVKGAKPVAPEGNITDPTGIKQANLYYNAKDTMTKAVANNPEATDAVNAYLDKDVNAQGQKVSHSPQEAIGVANLVAGNKQALSALQSFEKSQPNHDPMWDLSDKDLRSFLSYEGTRATDPTKQAMTETETGFNNGQGLQEFTKERSAYYDNQGSFTSTSQTNPETPTYPTFQGQQGTDYGYYENTVKNGSSADKSAYLNAHPDVIEAMSQLSKYYNQLGVAQGGLALKDAPQLSASQESALQAYDQLPKGTGARTAWIKANPDLWNQITTTLAQDSLQRVSQEGGVNEFAGTQPSSQLLGGIAGLGQDIASSTDQSGNTTYSINPEAAYQQQSASSSSNSKPFIAYPKAPKKTKASVVRIKRRSLAKVKRTGKPQKVSIKSSKGALKKASIGKSAGPLKIG